MLGFKSTRAKGEDGEDRALRHLQAQGLKLEARNYRIGGGPRRPAGEIDLVMRDRAGVLVFVEVRQRGGGSHGGAAASVGATKRARLVRAAQHYLMNLSHLPVCRFDVVAIDGDRIEWLQAAFDAG
jgi:putative endonuclease